MTRRHRGAAAAAVASLWLSATGAAAAPAPAAAPLDAAPLPLAARRVPAGADECVVWQRELAFARTVESHDAAAFASFLHAGTVFDAGSAEADRGRDTVRRGWQEIVDGRSIALRWRPGIVHIGGEPGIALSRGTYILQRPGDGAPTFRVGMFQTVWVRDANDGIWRVLFDGPATTPQPMPDRAAAERWVIDQAMSDCAG